jgi:hypothetical protein
MVVWNDRKKRFDDDEIVSSDTKAGIFRLSIHRHINFEPDVWLCSCAHLFSQVTLKSKDLQGAKAEAIANLKLIFDVALSDLNK